MLPYTQYLCRDNLYTCIVLPFFLPFFFTRTILNRDNKSRYFPAKKGLKICLRKSARPTRLPSRSLFLDRTRIPPGFPQDLSVVSAGRIHTVDNIFHRQLAVMSDKSILGEGRLEGRARQAAASKGCTRWAEKGCAFQPYPIPRFRRRLFYR